MSMSRRVLSTVPRALATSIRPSVVPVITRAPAVLVSTKSQNRSYHENVVRHYESPQNVGSMDKTDPNVYSALVGAPACGDVMKLQIRVDSDTQTITDVKFKTFGCGSAIASSSYLTTLVKGMTLDQASKVKNTEIAKELCLPPVKLHCSMLAEDAIKGALKQYYKKNPKAKQTDLGISGSAMPKIEIEKVTTTSDTSASAMA